MLRIISTGQTYMPQAPKTPDFLTSLTLKQHDILIVILSNMPAEDITHVAASNHTLRDFIYQSPYSFRVWKASLKQLGLERAHIKVLGDAHTKQPLNFKSLIEKFVVAKFIRNISITAQPPLEISSLYYKIFPASQGLHEHIILDYCKKTNSLIYENEIVRLERLLSEPLTTASSNLFNDLLNKTLNLIDILPMDWKDFSLGIKALRPYIRDFIANKLAADPYLQRLPVSAKRVTYLTLMKAQFFTKNGTPVVPRIKAQIQHLSPLEIIPFLDAIFSPDKISLPSSIIIPIVFCDGVPINDLQKTEVIKWVQKNSAHLITCEEDLVKISAYLTPHTFMKSFPTEIITIAEFSVEFSIKLFNSKYAANPLTISRRQDYAIKRLQFSDKWDPTLTFEKNLIALLKNYSALPWSLSGFLPGNNSIPNDEQVFIRSITRLIEASLKYPDNYRSPHSLSEERLISLILRIILCLEIPNTYLHRQQSNHCIPEDKKIIPGKLSQLQTIELSLPPGFVLELNPESPIIMLLEFLLEKTIQYLLQLQQYKENVLSVHELLEHAREFRLDSVKILLTYFPDYRPSCERKVAQFFTTQVSGAQYYAALVTRHTPARLTLSRDLILDHLRFPLRKICLILILALQQRHIELKDFVQLMQRLVAIKDLQGVSDIHNAPSSYASFISDSHRESSFLVYLIRFAQHSRAAIHDIPLRQILSGSEDINFDVMDSGNTNFGATDHIFAGIFYLGIQDIENAQKHLNIARHHSPQNKEEHEGMLSLEKSIASFAADEAIESTSLRSDLSPRK